MQLQIILAGVGGQGILFASKLLSELGMRLGLDVIGSETHGMSQRGGSVTAHLKMGSFDSPMIRSGTADILYSFEENETYKTLKFLKRGGACFVNLANPDQFNKKILNYLHEQEITFRAYDASGIATTVGSVLSTNIVLLGYSVGTGLVPYKCEEMRDVLRSVSGKKFLETNLEAFDAGVKDGRHAGRRPE
jgi:indolepyruvate ferredoxin oxidoreductase beta subunit